MSLHSASSSSPPHNKLILLIGRPVLFDRWHSNFFTRDVVYFHRSNPDWIIFEDSSFDRQHAHQLIGLYRHLQLDLNVSLLELHHQQCVNIFEGIRTLVENWSDKANIRLDVEYEIVNPEHDLEPYDTLLQEYPRISHLFWMNHRIETNGILLNEGDDGMPGNEEDVAEGVMGSLLDE